MSIADEKIYSLIDRFNRGDRAALAKVITMVESTADESRKDRDKILQNLTVKGDTIRIAISGPPGVGKSTLINRLGKKLLQRELKVAVLAIDPSSELSLGSILGDKTRMKDLLSCERAFIRPSASRGFLGGVGEATRDVVFVVEAFGFDVVIIETVGVGQSESTAHCLVDHFVVLVQPGSGDSLQAMKKGILERAHFVLITKADGPHQDLAMSAADAVRSSLKKDGLFIEAISSLNDDDVDKFLDSVLQRHEHLINTGLIAKIRRKQLEAIFLYSLGQKLASKICASPWLLAKCRNELSGQEDQGPISPLLGELTDSIIKKIKFF